MEEGQPILEPEPWILASADGERGYAEEAPPFDTDRSVSFTPASTVSGTRLLMRTSADGYFVVDLA